MNLKEFKKIINNIPTNYDTVEVSFLCNSQEYFVKDFDDIEWYKDDMNSNKKMIDITVKR